jgi:hypothetical protein
MKEESMADGRPVFYVYLVETPPEELLPGDIRRATVVARDEPGAIRVLRQAVNNGPVYAGPRDVGTYRRRDIAVRCRPPDEDGCHVTVVGRADTGPRRVLSVEPFSDA